MKEQLDRVPGQSQNGLSKESPQDKIKQGQNEQKDDLFRTKRNYVQVDNDKREHLINIVQTQGVTIKKAAQMLSINYSTAKHIVKQHKLMNYGNMQNINNAAFMNIQANYANTNKTQAELAQIKQQKLFNDYVNVGISHRIASGLSGRMSGLLNDDYRNVPRDEESKTPVAKSPEEESITVLQKANATKQEIPEVLCPEIKIEVKEEPKEDVIRQANSAQVSIDLSKSIAQNKPFHQAFPSGNVQEPTTGDPILVKNASSWMQNSTNSGGNVRIQVQQGYRPVQYQQMQPHKFEENQQYQLIKQLMQNNSSTVSMMNINEQQSNHNPQSQQFVGNKRNFSDFYYEKSASQQPTPPIFKAINGPPEVGFSGIIRQQTANKMILHPNNMITKNLIFADNPNETKNIEDEIMKKKTNFLYSTEILKADTFVVKANQTGIIQHQNYAKYDYPQPRLTSSLTPMYRGNSYIYPNNGENVANAVNQQIQDDKMQQENSGCVKSDPKQDQQMDYQIPQPPRKFRTSNHNLKIANQGQKSAPSIPLPRKNIYSQQIEVNELDKKENLVNWAPTPNALTFQQIKSIQNAHINMMMNNNQITHANTPNTIGTHNQQQKLNISSDDLDTHRVQQQIDQHNEINQSTQNPQKMNLRLPYLANMVKTDQNSVNNNLKKIQNKKPANSSDSNSVSHSSESAQKVGFLKLNEDIKRSIQKEEIIKLQAIKMEQGQMKMDPKIVQKRTHDENSYQTISFMQGSIGQNNNSVSAVNIKNHKIDKNKEVMIKSVYKLMMNEECQDFSTVEIENLQKFINKLSSVKKSVKKQYDKQVMALIQQQKNQKKRFCDEQIKEQDSAASSEESEGQKPLPQIVLQEINKESFQS